jgi:class 3 adenylate cyclase
MRCASCGFDNPDGAKFCNECAAPFVVPCPSCGLPNRAGAKFCSECAAALAIRAAETGPSTASRPMPLPEKPGITLGAPATHQDALQGERKTVTALFADIKGSMVLEENLDPEEARAIVDPALKLMIQATRRYDGYVVQSTGDGIFALFGAPIAHEDHPQRALYAAIRMQEDIRRYNETLLGDG